MLDVRKASFTIGHMLKQIISDMDRTLVERDGPTLPDFLEHLAQSVIESLKHPTQPVLNAGAEALADAYTRGEPLGYGTAQKVFVAMLNAAGGNQ